MEKPFLDARDAASIDLDLHSLKFIYLYLRILLARASSQMRPQCIDFSKQMLHLLKHMVSDFEELYTGIAWNLICAPFTPFLELFGEIVLNGKGVSNENREALAAIEQLPVYLSKWRLRNSLAAKLERIAVTFVQHARSVLDPRDSIGETAQASSIPTPFLPDPWPSNGNMIHWDTFFNLPNQPLSGDYDALETDLDVWTTDFLQDAVFDWIGFDGGQGGNAQY